MRSDPLYRTANIFRLVLDHWTSCLLGFRAAWLAQLALTAAWLAQLVERQSAVREVDGSSPRPDQHSGS